MHPRIFFLLMASFLLAPAARAEEPAPAEGRRPADEADLRFWLENMVWHHRFRPEEAADALGMTVKGVQAAQERLKISDATRPVRKPGAPLLVLPYPGGRHPRIGFLEGAIRPQRETKVSVFAPWDPAGYIVADVPEAIWSNLGLTYLAHTHVPTLWTKKEVELPRLEWKRGKEGLLTMERTLPNGIRFGTEVKPGAEAVRMRMWLHNGTKEKLTGLRVQNCVMLKGLKGFTAQSNDNKVFKPPFAAAHSADKKRWVVTAWLPNQRTWANPRCPCLHSDPRFPDCPPGGKRELKGWLSFFEGEDVEAEFRRIEKLLR